MGKPTPGPWEWVKSQFYNGYSGIIGPDGTEVLYPDHCNDGDTGAAWFEEFPSEADGALLISAPELLHELGAIADALAAGDTVTIEPGSVKAERIRCVIAKAEINDQPH